MHHYLGTSILLWLATFSDLAHAYNWPSPQYDVLEGFIYEGRRPDGSSLSTLVHPCRTRTTTGSSIAAEWLRFAFHDMATHNVDDGTGGLDGSIVYELGRSENFGEGFNQTHDDFMSFPNKYASRADIIAIGTVFAVNTCGGPIIPFRGGRVDSFVAGNTGTPEPQQDLATHIEQFRKQGFSQSDMIKLVACGHTVGGVRSTDFPTLVPAKDNSTKPTIVDFDSTTAFDDKVVTEYLDGTTQNVLVVSSNTNMTSDLRVFSSDGNSTMHSISSADTFANECKSVLERMLNTVQHGVTLTDEITLLPAKVTSADLTIENQQLVFKSSLRLAQLINGTANTNRTVIMYWCDRYGDGKDCSGSNTRYSSYANLVTDNANISPVTQNLGYYFTTYNFVVPINSTASISKFWFKVDENNGSAATTYNNGGGNYVVDQDQVIFIPTMSSSVSVSNATGPIVYTNRNGQKFTKVYNIIAAVRDGSSPSRVYVDAYDSAITDYPEPLNYTVDLSLNTSATALQGYRIYNGTISDLGFQLSLDFHADINGTTYTNDFKLTTYLDNTVIVAPTTVNSTSLSATTKSAAWRVDGWSRYDIVLAVGLGIMLDVLL